MEHTVTAGLIDYQPGTAYPVKNIYHLTDGTTQQADGWIIVWDILHDGDKKPDDPDDKKEEPSILLITAGVPDERNPKRIVPSGHPHRATYHLGTWQITPAWEARTDHGHRLPTQYKDTDPGSNSAEIMQASYRRELAALDDWHTHLDPTQAALEAARKLAATLVEKRDRMILQALADGESATTLARRYKIDRSAIYQMKTRAQAREE
jgi:hypothetical protein